MEVREKEVQLGELRQQLSILDARCQSQQEELQGMSEQLTEVSVLPCVVANSFPYMMAGDTFVKNTFNRDTVREEALRHQREWDDQKDRLISEAQRLGQEVDRLTEENEYLRKGLQKLLQ